MNNFKAYSLSFTSVIWRFYLMMAIVIVAGFSGYWLVGLIALPIFLSIMIGVEFKLPKRKSSLKITSSDNIPSIDTPKNDFPKAA